MAITNRSSLDTGQENEIILEILSYAGGENTLSEDHVMEANEARVVENWDAVSIGGMQRSKGFNLVASGAGATASDLAHFHFEDSTAAGQFLGIIGGNLVKVNGAAVTTITAGVFTSGILSHAAEGEDDSWITNSTNNLRRYTIAGGLTTPASQPSSAKERIYRHKNRLIAEGGSPRIHGSRVGVGNWVAANAWSLANDAWNIDIPNNSKGCAVGFPSGDTITVFDKFRAYLLSGFPNTRFDPLPNSRGCAAPLSIAVGDEGVYFLSDYPTLDVILWDGVKFIPITKRITDSFVEKIDLSKRVFGVYRDNSYHIFYNELNSGVSYPNRWKIFSTKANSARWMSRIVNANLSDNMGYPALLTKQNNELYAWSSKKKVIYDLETADDSDDGNDTDANYKTKDYTSRDFLSSAGARSVPIDEALIKLTKVTITYFGTTGVLTFQWTADRGRVSGSQTFDLSAGGDLINTTFIVNTSEIVDASSISDKKITKSLSNSAVGRTFNFQLLNSGTSTRPKIKKIKVHGLLVTED